MEITIIKTNGSFEQMFIGGCTQQVKDWIKQLNDNPLNSKEWTYEVIYVDKSQYQLAEFLGIV